MSVSKRILAGLSVSALMLGGAVSTASAAPINVPWSPDGAPDSEIRFDSDGITYYGSIRPAVGELRGAALLLPGSGPTDRNGNQAGGITPNTLAYVADALAARGVTTLRFDKIGTGRTGFDGFDPADPPGFTEQVDGAFAAAEVLSEYAGVRGEDFAVLGHSEGGLTALALTERVPEIGKLGLLAPLSVRYLDLLRAQLGVQFDAAVASGQFTPADADARRARVDETIAALRSGSSLPYPDDEVLVSVGLTPVNAKFLAEADAIDPTTVAAGIPADTDVLLTCSEKDLNVSCDHTDRLFDAFTGPDVEYARLTTSSHTLGELGPLPATGYDIYVPLPQSSEFRGVLDAWADRTFA